MKKLICLFLSLVCVMSSAGCGKETAEIIRVGCPGIKFTTEDTDEVLFTGYNLLVIATEYEAGDETWEVKIFDGETWYTRIGGEHPNRWYVKFTLDDEGAKILTDYLTLGNLSIRGARDHFSFTSAIYKHTAHNTWYIFRGASAENATNLANYLLGNISTHEYEDTL